VNKVETGCRNPRNVSFGARQPRTDHSINFIILAPTNIEALFGNKMDNNDTSNNLEIGSGQTRVLRPKAPVDIEKQCGVALPSGNQCTRSLTCKRHGWSAKRAVPGRSAPFDQLLTDYL
jgi:hypothetical protein